MARIELPCLPRTPLLRLVSAFNARRLTVSLSAHEMEAASLSLQGSARVHWKPALGVHCICLRASLTQATSKLNAGRVRTMVLRGDTGKYRLVGFSRGHPISSVGVHSDFPVLFQVDDDVVLWAVVCEDGRRPDFRQVTSPAYLPVRHVRDIFPCRWRQQAC